jgi:hypothetical protein
MTLLLYASGDATETAGVEATLFICLPDNKGLRVPLCGQVGERAGKIVLPWEAGFISLHGLAQSSSDNVTIHKNT